MVKSEDDLTLQMSLLHYLLVSWMLAREKAMIEEIKIQEIEDMGLTLVDKEEI